MGGAFLTAEGKTKKKCKANLNALLDEAYKQNLVDLRGKTEPVKCKDGLWRAVAWVHS
jgi:hypothetical protein